MATVTLSELERCLSALGLDTPIPGFASSEVLHQPLDLYRSYLAEICCHLVKSDPSAAYNSVQLSNDPLHGDFTIILPKLCPGARAKEIAYDLLTKFPVNPLFDFPWADGVYLRTCVKPEVLPRLLVPFINDRKKGYGSDLAGVSHNQVSLEAGRQKLVVEFSSPNIAGDFQGKHLRSTILGAFVSKIHEEAGWDVTKINYLGDWGKDNALLGVGWEKYGDEDAIQKDAIGHLHEVYRKIHDDFAPEQVASKQARDEAKKKGEDEVEITAEIESKGVFAERNAFFKRMEERDEKAVALFKRIRDFNIDNYASFYARLGIIFDEYSGESQVSSETMTKVEQLLKDKGIAEESGGACVIDLKKLGAKAGTAIVRDRTGSSTYFLRYLAAVIERSRKSEFDKMIFVAADRTGHFSRLSKVLEVLDMPELAGKLQHVQFSDVSHMVDKLGDKHQPHEMLDQCEKAMLEVLKADEEKAQYLGASEEAAKVVGVTSLLAQEVFTKRSSDHAFDIENMTSFKLGTGPNLQYWHARLSELLKDHDDAEISAEDYASLSEEAHTTLLLTLGQYPEVTLAAYKSLEPSTIMTYLQGIVEHLSDCLDEEEDEEEDKPEKSGHEGDEEKEAAMKDDIEAEAQEEKSEPTLTAAQAALYAAARTVLENAMNLLGISPAPKVEQARVDSPVTTE